MYIWAPNLPLPTIFPFTTNRDSVLHVFLSDVCTCSVTTSVVFLFMFTLVRHWP